MTVEELIDELQSFNGDLNVAAHLYELDHTKFYGQVHAVKLIEKGEPYNDSFAYRDVVIIDGVT